MEKHHRLLAIPLLIFLTCFLIVGYNNRYASDDFEFLIKLREYGFLGSVEWFHSHWNTRWTSIAFLNGALLFTLNIGTLFWYHLISISLLWFALYRNIKNFVRKDIITHVSVSGFATIAFFYSCFSISDVFFWINTSTMYLYGCIALLFAVAEITSNTHTVASYLRLAVFGLFLAGAYEPLVFTSLVVCAVLFATLVSKHGWSVWKIHTDKKVIVLLSSLMLGFAISFSGEGHVARSAFLPQTDLTFKLWVWMKAIIKMFVIYIPGKILPVLLFSFPWFVIGANTGFTWLTPRRMQFVSVVFVALVIISLGPVAFIMSEMGPERAWTQITLYLVVYAAVLASYAGAALKRRYNVNNVLRIYAVIAFIYIVATGVPMVIVSSKYSKAYDNRVKILLEQAATERKESLYLKPLPSSGWLHSAEISNDTSHFNNIFLKEFFKLGFTPVSR